MLLCVWSRLISKQGCEVVCKVVLVLPHQPLPSPVHTLPSPPLPFLSSSLGSLCLTPPPHPSPPLPSPPLAHSSKHYCIKDSPSVCGYRQSNLFIISVLTRPYQSYAHRGHMHLYRFVCVYRMYIQYIRILLGASIHTRERDHITVVGAAVNELTWCSAGNRSLTVSLEHTSHWPTSCA